jgi:UDP-N-acetylmuramate dehydrogenase
MGFKGKQVGGARVSEMHANFIVTQQGAKAGDVMQLILAIQDKAARERGVVLETEVQILGEG